MTASSAGWRRAFARFGLPGVTSVLLLGVAAWGEWVEVPQVEQATSELLQRYAAVQAKTSAYRGGAAPAQTIAKVRRLLPAHSKADDLTAALLDSAHRHGLIVDSVQYLRGRSPLNGVEHLSLTFPVKGSYEALRMWMAESLRNEAGLSIDSLSIRRSGPQSPTVDADVWLSLWTSAEGGEAVAAAKENP